MVYKNGPSFNMEMLDVGTWPHRRKVQRNHGFHPTGWNSGLSNVKCGFNGFNVQKSQHEIPCPTVLQFWHWTIWHPWWQDPTWSWHSETPGNSLQFSAREMSAGSDSGGNLFFSRYTLFHMFWAWNPTMSQFQRLKSIEIIFFMVWIQEWGSLSWWFIAGATLRWRKIFCRTREKIEKWMEIFFSIVNSMYLYHSLSDLQNRDTYIRSDSMTGGFNRWPRAIDATGTAELW
jgi:hypothetical protein